MSVMGLEPIVFRSRPPYLVDVRFVGTPPSDRVVRAVELAAARIAKMITGTVSSTRISNFNYALECALSGAPVVDETIDDILIFFRVLPIDGPGGTLGSAGPCILRSETLLPVMGDVLLDAADVAAVGDDAAIHDLVLHEMLHVVGLGVLWRSEAQGSLVGEGGRDPQFSGVQARQQFALLGGSVLQFPQGVPVENTGGSGTRDAHWRENVLGRELMTGFYNAGGPNPVSAITIAALGDFGYHVSFAGADHYTVTSQWMGLLAAEQLPIRVHQHTRLHAPSATVDSLGRFVPIRRQGSR
jgi:hypothetical protein